MVEIKVFLTFLLVDGRIRILTQIRIRQIMPDPGQDPGGSKTYGSGVSGSGSTPLGRNILPFEVVRQVSISCPCLSSELCF
jgi:hypothetical protein